MDIINWKHNKLETAAVFSSDMSKAFDSRHSPLLIAKLRAFYGFSDEVLGLIQSYSLGLIQIFLRKKVQGKNRSRNNQWVLWNNKGLRTRIFLWATLLECIPKWFALPGEKLNIIHVRWRPSMKWSHAAETIKEVEQILNEERNKASQWYNENFLRGNFSKCQTI